MAGRNDFGIVRSGFYFDPRTLAAAELCVLRGYAQEPFAVSLVAGLVSQLGLWAMRETDDGVLAGDGVAVVRHATSLPAALCRDVVAVLREAGLLRDVEGGVYLVGFRDCYAPILDHRETNRSKAKRRRAKRKAAEAAAAAAAGDVTAAYPGTSPQRSGKVPPSSPQRVEPPAVPFRSVPSDPFPPPSVADAVADAAANGTTNGHGGGNGSAAPVERKRLSPPLASGVRAMAAVFREGTHGDVEAAKAREVLAALKAGTLTPKRALAYRDERMGVEPARIAFLGAFASTAAEGT